MYFADEQHHVPRGRQQAIQRAEVIGRQRLIPLVLGGMANEVTRQPEILLRAAAHRDPRACHWLVYVRSRLLQATPQRRLVDPEIDTH